MMRGLLRACVSFVWLILLSAPAFAQVEVKVFVGGAMTVPVKEAGVAFARSSGNTLVYVSDTTGALQKRLAAGEKVTFHITNEGDTTHNFSIDSLNINENIDAGQSADIQVTFPSSGSVEFYCSIHKTLGMTGTLQVA